MILCCDQLQVRILAGFLRVVAHVHRDLFSRRRRHSKRLPCIQPAESAVRIPGRNAVMYLNCPAQLRLQNVLCCLQFSFQLLFIRMVFPAIRVLCVDSCPESVNRGLVHFTFQLCM